MPTIPVRWGVRGCKWGMADTTITVRSFVSRETSKCTAEGFAVELAPILMAGVVFQ
jgi:hypothetical protein